MLKPEDLGEFAELLERRFGFGDDPARYADLASLLERRMEAHRLGAFAQYREQLLENPEEPGVREWETLAGLLTVGESYFFRMPEHFEALADAVLPEILPERATARRLRLLSAGCASGEEPYSLRILLNERFAQLADWDVRIDAFDLSPGALSRAAAGVYSEWALRATSVERRRANFQLTGPTGKQFLLEEHARRGVRFFPGNLLDPPPEQELPYDVIFCRNVLIYFSDAAIRRAISILARRLAPGGYLFLGPAESLRGVSKNFVLNQTHQVFYYRRRERLLPEPESFAPAPSVRPGGTARVTRKSIPARQLRAEDLHDAGWYHAIVSSSERMAAMMPGSVPAATPPEAHEDAQDPAWNEDWQDQQEAPMQAGQPRRASGAKTARAAAELRRLRQAAAPAQSASGNPLAKQDRAKQVRAPDSAQTPAQEASWKAKPNDSEQSGAARLLGYMQSNRFADALALLEAGSLDPEAVPAAVSRPLLHASLLTHLGRFEEADREATLVLDADPLNAGAHFVRGLCKEHAGALSEAEQHMTEATYLDPGFAMPQLYRGLLARRRQDVDAARTSFKRAVTALTAEDPDRLTIFAGNLSRQDLRQLCVRELERMRGL